MNIFSRIINFFSSGPGPLSDCKGCPAMGISDHLYDRINTCCLYDLVYTNGSKCWQKEQLMQGVIPKPGWPRGFGINTYFVISTKRPAKTIKKKIPTYQEINDRLAEQNTNTPPIAPMTRKIKEGKT